MAYWGIAYAGGPNYDKSWERFDETDLKQALHKCHLASSKARELASIPLKIALIDALCVRFPSDREGDYKHWNRTYREETDKVYEIHGDHLDVIALYADSSMALAPWQLWDLHTGAPREDSCTLHIQSSSRNHFTTLHLSTTLVSFFTSTSILWSYLRNRSSLFPQQIDCLASALTVVTSITFLATSIYWSVTIEGLSRPSSRQSEETRSTWTKVLPLISTPSTVFTIILFQFTLAC